MRDVRRGWLSLCAQLAAGVLPSLHVVSATEIVHARRLQATQRESGKGQIPPTRAAAVGLSPTTARPRRTPSPAFPCWTIHCLAPRTDEDSCQLTMVEPIGTLVRPEPREASRLGVTSSPGCRGVAGKRGR